MQSITKEQVVGKLKGFSLKDLDEMEKKNLISFPISEHELGLLAFLHSFWRKKRWIKRQMTRFSKKNRQYLIDTCALDKIETYIYSRLVNSSLEGTRLSTTKLIKEVAYYYKSSHSVNMSEKLEKTVLRMRRMVKKAITK